MNSLEKINFEGEKPKIDEIINQTEVGLRRFFKHDYEPRSEGNRKMWCQIAPDFVAYVAEKHGFKAKVIQNTSIQPPDCHSRPLAFQHAFTIIENDASFLVDLSVLQNTNIKTGNLEVYSFGIKAWVPVAKVEGDPLFSSLRDFGFVPLTEEYARHYLETLGGGVPWSSQESAIEAIKKVNDIRDHKPRELEVFLN